MTSLKPVSLAFAAASLIGIAGLAPAKAQTGYPAPATPAYAGYQAGYAPTQSRYPAGQLDPGYPGVENSSPGTGLPYPGPQAATPNVENTYPSAKPNYYGGNSAAAPQAATSYQPRAAAPYQSSEAMQPQPRTGYQPPERTQLVTNGPQANVENESPNWSARQNVINSHRYERLIATDHAFRNARMRMECGPITDPQLHANCIASFENRG